MPDVFSSFVVRNVWDSGAVNKTVGYCRFLKAVTAEPGVRYHDAITSGGTREVAFTNGRCKGTVRIAQSEMMPDVYSVRELRMCEAERIKLKDGKPWSWSVRLEFNTRNQAAGYTGIRRYVAIFKNGKIAYPIGAADFVGRDGFNGIFNRMVDKQMEHCPAIRDADIQQALATAIGQ